MDNGDDLYVEIGTVTDETVEVPVYTYIAMFVLDCCEVYDINIYFVKSNASSQFCIPVKVTEHFKFKFIEFDDLPQNVKDSHFPVIHSVNSLTCIGGLCAVVRWAIKTNPNDSYSDLLGFRNGCLMACSENSIWTKFCEVDMPNSVNLLIDRKSNRNEESVLPSDLLKLEFHLQHPVKTHNILKRKQEFVNKMKSHQNNESHSGKDVFEMSSLKESLEEQLEIKKKSSSPPSEYTMDKSCVNVKLPHIYVEGIDFTIADVILLPTVHHLLTELRPWKSEIERNLPLLLNWYRRLLKNEYISKLIDTWKWVKWEDIFIETYRNDIKIPEIQKESLYTRDPLRCKPRMRNRDPAEIIDKLTIAGVCPYYSAHPFKNNTSLEWEALPRAVHPAGGDLPLNRIMRKCHQVESIVTAVLSLAVPGNLIVDFCAGGGHVGILIAYLRPSCKVILIENKESSMDRARARAKELQLRNVFFYQCNMDYFCGRFDIGVCLHACGVATDLVIRQCLSQNASFVCCPCCYGSIKNSHLVQYPRSEKFRECGVSYEEYQLLCHCADRTEVATPKVEEGKYCMSIIDTDRYFHAYENNYNIRLTTLQPPSCTPKSNLLIGVPKSNN
ncbi:glutathione S-transferase C-terminal domain-containing protein-like [Centruroides sculpturatus]|uniref:glutathione S-transferase C-terminal domain-containing protein-like n=1 Tax=Centruroides sculpturatus TaxID=218467 RepID=UPI000C6E3D6E|nr:glutathione S-transferase C-terminal domain-containing protein-like [Centruroides sculpturatus]